jgi:GAF domain-containing protein
MRNDPDYPAGEHEVFRLRRLRGTDFANTTNLPELDQLCIDATLHFGTDIAVVTSLTEDVQILKACAGTDIDQAQCEVAFCSYTIVEDAILVVSDANQDPLFRQSPILLGPSSVQVYAGVPLSHMASIPLRAFCLIGSRPRPDFSRWEMAELVDFAEWAVQGLAATLGRIGRNIE